MMLRDDIGTKIVMCEKPNGHILCTGMSGSGKTYFLIHRICQNAERDEPTVVVDYSDSFTKEELQKAGIQADNQIQIINLAKEKFTIPIFEGISTDGNVLSEILSEALGICGYLQKQELKQACQFACLQNQPKFQDILQFVVKEIESTEEYDRKSRLEKLLNKLEVLVPLGKLSFWKSEAEVQKKTVSIINFSEIPFESKKVGTELIMAGIWKGVKRGMLFGQCIVLDECQHVDFRQGKTAWELVREGRKFGVKVWMATQFLQGKEAEEIETMMQSSNKLFFKPTVTQMKMLEKWIGDTDGWRQIINTMTTGQAILLGHYTVNSNSEVIQCPILVNVEDS